MSEMKCPRCGSKIPDNDAKFCNYCGGAISPDTNRAPESMDARSSRITFLDWVFGTKFRNWVVGGILGVITAIVLIGIFFPDSSPESAGDGGSAVNPSTQIKTGAATDVSTKPAQPHPSNLDDSLLKAAESGDLDSVERLLQQGASASAKEEEGAALSVLDHAARSGNASVVRRVLAAGAPVDNSALSWAGYSGSVPMIGDLLAAGANIESGAGTEIGTALIQAVEFNHYDAVVALIDAGASVNSRDRLGQTPLHLAASNGYAEIARLLIQHGATVDSIAGVWLNKETPLMTAAASNKVEVLQVLLESGANPLLKDSDGRTALMIASHSGRTAAAQILIAHMNKFWR